MSKQCDCGSCNCNNKTKDKKVKAYFCPKCKSTNVKYVFELKNAFGVIPKMRCLNCKTEMSSFPIIKTTQGEIKEAIEAKPTVKTKGVVKKKTIKPNNTKRKSGENLKLVKK